MFPVLESTETSAALIFYYRHLHAVLVSLKIQEKNKEIILLTKQVKAKKYVPFDIVSIVGSASCNGCLFPTLSTATTNKIYYFPGSSGSFTTDLVTPSTIAS